MRAVKAIDLDLDLDLELAHARTSHDCRDPDHPVGMRQLRLGGVHSTQKHSALTFSFQSLSTIQLRRRLDQSA